MREIAFDKIVDALLYMGVIDDEDQINGIHEIQIDSTTVRIHTYAADEEGDLVFNMNGQIMLDWVEVPIARTEQVEVPDDEDQEERHQIPIAEFGVLPEDYRTVPGRVVEPPHSQ